MSGCFRQLLPACTHVCILEWLFDESDDTQEFRDTTDVLQSCGPKFLWLSYSQTTRYLLRVLSFDDHVCLHNTYAHTHPLHITPSVYVYVCLCLSLTVYGKL